MATLGERVTSMAGSGGKLTASVQLMNRLAGLVSGKVTVRLFASTDAGLDGSDVELTAVTKKVKLRTGSGKLLRIKLPRLAAVPEGTFHLIARVERPDGYADELLAPQQVQLAPLPLRRRGR